MTTNKNNFMPAKTFAFVSLGCPKNLVDSERMLGKLAQDGYALTPDAEGADVVVVNTCGFIEPARQESLAVIREMLALKESGRVGSVVVATGHRTGSARLPSARAKPTSPGEAGLGRQARACLAVIFRDALRGPARQTGQARPSAT